MRTDLKISIILLITILCSGFINKNRIIDKDEKEAENFRIFKTMRVERGYLKAYEKTLRSWNIPFQEMTPFSKDDLKSLNIPVLLLIGDHDLINNKNSIENAKKSIPDLKSETIMNAGHFLSFDQAEIINKKTLDFLK